MTGTVDHMDENEDNWTSVQQLINAYKKGGTDFATVRAEFQETRKVKIIDEYFAPGRSAGVVLVSEKSGRRPFRRERYRVDLRYDPSAYDPSVGKMLRDVQNEEGKWSLLLSGNPQKALAQTSHNLIAYILSFVRTPNNGHKQRADQGNMKGVNSSVRGVRH